MAMIICGKYGNNRSRTENIIYTADTIFNVKVKWPWRYRSRSKVITVCEIMFAEVIDNRSRVKMIHHRPTVYTCRPVMVSSRKTHEITIDRRATRLDSLPSPTQFYPDPVFGLWEKSHTVITRDTPSHASDHLWLIWKESIKNCRCYRADTIFKAKAKWPWRYRSRSKVIICNTPSHTSDHLCRLC